MYEIKVVVCNHLKVKSVQLKLLYILCNVYKKEKSSSLICPECVVSFSFKKVFGK